MFDQDKLLRLIDEDLKVCRDAASKLSPGDKRGRDRNVLEFNTLMAHLDWTRRAGTDEAELGRIVDSLEGNEFLRGYQRWREQCETKSCPEHREPMRFPTSLRLASGNVIEHLYYCPVQGCVWRHANGIGYKKATEF